jgi:hypothetical protein
MSDVEISTNDPFVHMLVEKWFTSFDQLEALDEKMNVESYTRTKLLNAAFDEANPNMEGKQANNPVAVAVRSALSADGITQETLAGLYESVRRTLREFEKKIDNYIEKNTPKPEDVKKNQPTVEELQEMRDEYKKHVENMNGIRGLLEGTATDWFKAEGDSLLPKKEAKRGSVGSRGETGTRLGATFQFTVIAPDGTEHVLSDRKLGAVQIFLKKDVKNVKEVRSAVETSNPEFDWKNPPDRFEFTIAGRKVVGNKITDESSDDSDDESDIQELTLDVDEDFEDAGEASTVTELFDDDEE